MGADPACSQLYAGTRPTHEFVVKSADGGLANAFVHVQGSFPGTPVPSTPVTIDQQGCVYRPRVIGVRAGQVLQARNSDKTLHNLHSRSVKGNDFNVSQLAGGAPYTVTMAREEMMLRITCDVHSWMNIYVAVMDHPYFTVSGSDGGFVISGVPPGRQRVQVWHERYGPLTATVDVPPGGAATVDFTYAGTEKAAPPTSVP
jgi:plastocyanin